MRDNGERELQAYECYQIIPHEFVASHENFILSRVLGHPEIPGSDRWTVSKECYMCGRWQYTVFMKQHEKIGAPSANPLGGMFRGLKKKQPA